jgi:hypothetical protein
VNATSLTAHWHLSADRINLLATNRTFRANCFESNNNFTRYWEGVTSYRFSGVVAATSSRDALVGGTSYPTVWASHQWGLLSGNNEATAVITSHSGDHWACAGNAGPGGEGYTGRNGLSNMRLWVR